MANRKSFFETMRSRAEEGAKASWKNIIIPQGLNLVRGILVSIIDAVVLGKMATASTTASAVGVVVDDAGKTDYNGISTSSTALYSGARKAQHGVNRKTPAFSTRAKAEEVLETMTTLAEEQNYVTVGDMLSLTGNAEPSEWVDSMYGWNTPMLAAFRIDFIPGSGKYEFRYPAPRPVSEFK